jgi:phosphopantothenoylcysteine decarboxylase/phosphopantothenate--cysteine ligase
MSMPAEANMNPELKACAGRRILIGLTGGIACYKMGYVVSALAQADAAVTVVMTEAATRFVTPLTFEALSGRPVYTSQWQRIESHDPQHISLANAADVMLIAPCTMDMLAKIATGRTDDVVSLTVSAIDQSTTPVLVAPSMNTVMYRQPSTMRNLKQLAEDGYRVIEPGSGWQACRTSGPGRLPEPAELAHMVANAIANSDFA